MIFCMQLTAMKPLYYLYESYLLHFIPCLMKYYWIGCLNAAVLQGLYKKGSHPICHLVHNMFKLNVQDLLELNCGVPQGSVLGLLLYVLYTSPVADIIKRHNLTYHLYTDDTQLYVLFKLGSDDLLSSAKSSIEICVQEINNWMILNES